MIIGLLLELGILAGQVLLRVNLLVLGQLLLLLLLPLHIPVLLVVLVGEHIGILLLSPQHLLVLGLLGVLAHESGLHVGIRGKLLIARVLRLLGRHALYSILPSDLMVLHLLNYLLHVLTCVLQLGKLLSELLVEGLEGNYFLGWRHALDSCQQVVSHVVRHLKNAVLLQVNLSHTDVLNLID